MQIEVFGATAQACGNGPAGMFVAGFGAADALAVTPRSNTVATRIARHSGAMRRLRGAASVVSVVIRLLANHRWW